MEGDGRVSECFETDQLYLSLLVARLCAQKRGPHPAAQELLFRHHIGRLLALELGIGLKPRNLEEAVHRLLQTAFTLRRRAHIPVLEASSRIPQADLRHRRSPGGSGWGTTVTLPLLSQAPLPPSRSGHLGVVTVSRSVQEYPWKHGPLCRVRVSLCFQQPGQHVFPSMPWQDLTRDRPSPRAVPMCRPRVSIGHAGRQRLPSCGQWREQTKADLPVDERAVLGRGRHT